LLDPAEIIAHLEKMRVILDAFRREINATIELVAQIPAPAHEKVRCPHCGIDKPNQTRLDDHLLNVHGLSPSCLVTEGSVAGVDGLTTLGQGTGAAE